MTSRAVRTAARVASEMPCLPLRTRLTVASLTPACLATSARFRATLQLYGQVAASLAVRCALGDHLQRSAIDPDRPCGAETRVDSAGCCRVARGRRSW